MEFLAFMRQFDPRAPVARRYRYFPLDVVRYYLRAGAPSAISGTWQMTNPTGHPPRATHKPVIVRATPAPAAPRSCSDENGAVPRPDLPLVRREFLKGSGILMGTIVA